MNRNKQMETYGLRPVSIDKVINTGSFKDGYYIHALPVFCHIKYNDGRLSITGVIAPLKNGDARGSCGQIYGEIENHLDDTSYSDGWDKIKAFTFIEYWKTWHLNDMNAGCEHQEALGWKSYDEHPSEPCPTCGYKYGTSWLRREVPTDVLKWLEQLPTTPVKPNWI